MSGWTAAERSNAAPHRRLLSDEDWARRPEHIAPQDWARTSRLVRDRLAPIQVDDVALGLEPDRAVPQGQAPRTQYVQWAREGLTPEAIAERAGVKVSTVERNLRSAAARGDITLPERPSPRKEAGDRYRSLREQGLTRDEIASREGVSPRSVNRAIRYAEERDQETSMATRHGVEVQTADGPDYSWAPRDLADPGAWTSERADTWQRIGVPAQAVELDPTQLELPIPELEASL